MADTATRAQVHPLVLLSITEKITRNVVRAHTVPLLGGIVGHVTSKGVNLEHAFDIKLIRRDDGSGWDIDEEFFRTRVWQIQEVHKEPVQLEFMGFWTLGKAGTPPGPELKHILPVLLSNNGYALALMFHADLIESGSADEHQMPFTIFEPVYNKKPEAITNTSKSPVALPDSFQTIPWEFVTGEAEMISLEAVKNGGGNATRVKTGAQSELAAPAAQGQPTKNGSKDDKAKTQQKSRVATSDLYTAEEEEMLSFLTTRANAIRTLLNRLKSIQSYTDAAEKTPGSAGPELLRAIKAMLARLPSIEAAKNAQNSSEDSESSATFASTGATASPGISEALLVELLGSIGKNLQSTRELGGKFSAVESAKRERGRPRDGYGDPHLGGGGISEMMDLS